MTRYNRITQKPAPPEPGGPARIEMGRFYHSVKGCWKGDVYVGVKDMRDDTYALVNLNSQMTRSGFDSDGTLPADIVAVPVGTTVEVEVSA